MRFKEKIKNLANIVDWDKLIWFVIVACIILFLGIVLK